MTGRCTLNNMNMRNIRRSQDYQCVIIDLAMLGIVSKEEVEMLIGSGIPMNLRLPNGKNDMVSEESLLAPENREKIGTPPVTTNNTETEGTPVVTEGTPVVTEGTPVVTNDTETESTENTSVETTAPADENAVTEEKKGFKLFGGKKTGE